MTFARHVWWRTSLGVRWWSQNSVPQFQFSSAASAKATLDKTLDLECRRFRKEAVYSQACFQPLRARSILKALPDPIKFRGREWGMEVTGDKRGCRQIVPNPDECFPRCQALHLLPLPPQSRIRRYQISPQHSLRQPLELLFTFVSGRTSYKTL